MSDLTVVDTQARVSEIVNLAREIWRDHDVPIIGQEQVDYRDDYRMENTIANNHLGLHGTPQRTRRWT